MSIERSVVAFVLTPPVLLNVLGSETKEDEERDGTGEGGEVGGMGRIDASSSASNVFEFLQDETTEADDGLTE
jgi:hypothetical protein